MNATRDLQSVEKTFRRLARVVPALLLLAGAYFILTTIRPILPDSAQNLTWGERRVIGVIALVVGGGFAVAGWSARRLLDAAAGLVGAVAEGAEAAVRVGRLVETRLVPGVERAVAAIESLNAGAGADQLAPEVDAVRRAISEGRWTRAERLLDAFAADHPHAAHVVTLTASLSAARRAEGDALRAKLDAALVDDDPGTAITCRDALTRHLNGAELGDLDRRVVRWIARWVRQRARGEVSPDVASVATLAADRFADTDDGRSLLAAVPALRRKAGLCPECARPYVGSGGPCPDCADEHQPRPARGGATSRGVP